MAATDRVHEILDGRFGELLNKLKAGRRRVAQMVVEQHEAAPGWAWWPPIPVQDNETCKARNVWPRLVLWPSELPGELTVGDALDLVERDRAELVAEAARIVGDAVAQLMPRNRRDAVLARPDLTREWPWPRPAPGGKSCDPGVQIFEDGPFWWPYKASDVPALWESWFALHALIHAGTDGVLHGGSWPGGVKLGDVQRWASEELLDRADRADRAPELAALGEKLRRDARPLHPQLGSGLAWLPDYKVEPAAQCPPTAVARLYQVWREVEQDRARRAMYLDTGREHHAMVRNASDWRMDGRIELERHDQYVQLLPPDRPNKEVQLALPLDAPDGLHSATIRELLRVKGGRGLRHWAALQRLLSVEGGRQGWVRWTLDSHLDAMGYTARSQRSRELRARVAQEVELLTRIELVVYRRSGRERERLNLLLVGSRYERLEESQWKLDGMELRINDRLYRGVRNLETGELGTYFWPAPVELAQLGDMYFPALALGLILPMRWRWDVAKGKDHLRLSGKNLLATAGIAYRERAPGVAWDVLRRNLDKLVQIDALGDVRWRAEEEQWTRQGVCLLYPPGWAADRAVHGVRAVETPVVEVPLTGAELRRWRKKRRLSLQRTAKSLGVSVSTVKRAEQRATRQLRRPLRESLSSYMGQNLT